MVAEVVVAAHATVVMMEAAMEATVEVVAVEVVEEVAAVAAANKRQKIIIYK